MLGISWTLPFQRETKCLPLFSAVFQMGSLVETVWQESQETLNRTEVLLYPYLYVSVKICKSSWPYIGLLEKQHAYGAAWSKVMWKCLCSHRDECLNEFQHFENLIWIQFMMVGNFTWNVFFFFLALFLSWVTLFCDSCRVFFFFRKYEENVTTNELIGCVLFSKGAREQRWALIHRSYTNFWSGLVWTHTQNRQTNLTQLLSQRVSVSSNGGNTCSYRFSGIMKRNIAKNLKIRLSAVSRTDSWVGFSSEKRWRWLKMIKYKLFSGCINSP